MKMNYTKENLDKVSEVIKKHLTTDLVPLKWSHKNRGNPMYGHCHTASGGLYKIFGSENLHVIGSLPNYEELRRKSGTLNHYVNMHQYSTPSTDFARILE